jgi:hypothetical protein
MKKFYTLILLLATTVGVMAQQSESITPSADAQAMQPLNPNEARKQRGFTADTNFVPKGQWIFGGTASYSAHQNKNYKLLVISDIDSEGYTVNVSPMIAYAPWNNMALGVRFGYGRSLISLDNSSLTVSGADMTVDMFHQIKHTYTGTLFWRPYIPLGNSSRFAFFAEVQLNMSGGQSKTIAETSVIDGMQDYRGTYSRNFGASVGLQPGIVAFITNNAAVELSIGVLGIGFDRTLQTKNQIEEGKLQSIDTNFKLNLLSVGFGMSFYL